MSATAPGKRPLVTAIVTVYNQAHYLPAALDSVLEQNVQDLEVLLIDDGSTDDIQSVLEVYGDRVRYIRRENGGLAAARNTGLFEARGEYIAYCDSDDIHLPWRISSQLAILEKFPAAAQVYADMKTWTDGEVTAESTLRDRSLGPTRKPFDEEIADAYGEGHSAREAGIPLPEEYADRKFYVGRIPQLISVYHIAWGGASLYRKSALMAIDGHDEKLRRWQDWYVSSRLSKMYEQIFLDAPVVLYRQHGGQLTKMQKLGIWCHHRVAYNVWRTDPVFGAQYPDSMARVISNAAMRMAHIHIKEGEYAEAQPLLVDAVRAQPTNRKAYTALLRAMVMERVQQVRG